MKWRPLASWRGYLLDLVFNFILSLAACSLGTELWGFLPELLFAVLLSIMVWLWVWCFPPNMPPQVVWDAIYQVCQFVWWAVCSSWLTVAESAYLTPASGPVLLRQLALWLGSLWPSFPWQGLSSAFSVKVSSLRKKKTVCLSLFLVSSTQQY